MKVKPAGPAVLETNEVWRITDLLLLRSDLAFILLTSAASATSVMVRGVNPTTGVTVWQSSVAIPSAGLSVGCLFKLDEHTVGVYSVQPGALGAAVVAMASFTDAGVIKAATSTFPHPVQRAKEQCYSTFDVSAGKLYGIAWENSTLPDRIAWGFSVNFSTLAVDATWSITEGQADAYNYYEVVPMSQLLYGGCLAVRPNGTDLKSWNLVDGNGVILDSSATYAGASKDAIVQATPDPSILAVLFMDDSQSATKPSQLWAQFYQVYPSFRKLDLSRAGFVKNSILTEVGVAADDLDYLNGLPFDQPRVLSTKYRFYDTALLQHSSQTIYPGAVSAVASLRRFKDRGDIYTVPMAKSSAISTQQLAACPIPPSYDPVQYAVATTTVSDLVLLGGSVGSIVGATTAPANGPSAADVGVTASGPSTLAGLSTNQLANAKTVIATGKSLGISGPNITIALMVAITESGLQNYANANIPESLVIPHDAVGSDHASVGIFQQQVGIYGTAAQIMNVGNSASMFFSRLQGAPSAGLSPWAIAQEVQISAFADGSNYRANYNRAIALSAALFDSTLAVPPASTDTNIAAATGGGGPAPAWVYSSYWGGYMADCGAYVGPWPAAPPIPANFPSGCSELDYLICPPNPSGLVQNTGDGSYPADYLDAFRSGPGGSAGANFYGGGPNIPTQVPVGAHLVVIWYNPSGVTTAPAVSAMTLVPPSYVAGGGGAAVGDPSAGHWSDWLPVQHATQTVYPNNFYNGTKGYQRQDAEQWLSLVSETTETPHQQAIVAAGATTTPYTGAYGVGQTGMRVTTSKFWGTDGSQNTQITVYGAQYILGYGLYVNLPVKGPAVSGLVEGVDYAAIPGQGAGSTTEYMQYEAPAITFTGWDDLTASWQVEAIMDGNTWPSAPFTVRFGVGAIANVGTDDWPAYGFGTALASYANNANALPADVPVSVSTPLPLSGVTTSEFALAVQLDYFGSNPLPAPSADLVVTAPVPPGGANSKTSSFAVSGSFPNNAIPGAVAHYDIPRYRYWIPGAPATPPAPASPFIPSPPQNTNVYQLVKVGLDNLAAQMAQPKAVNFW